MKDFVKKHKIHLSILILFSIIIYGRTIDYNYAVDDKTVVSQNKYVKEGLSAIPKIITSSYWEGYADEVGLVYRPIPLITYVLTGEIKNTPKAHHIVNIIIWCLALIILFYFLKIYLLKEVDAWYILFACLLWSVLPTNVEAIANIKGRDDVLCFLFSILSLIYLFKSINKSSLKNLILGGVFILLSLLSKETSIIMLPVIILILYIKKSLTSNWKIGATYIIFIGIALTIRGYITQGSEAIELVENNTVLAFSGLEKIYFQFFLLLEYHLKLLFPFSLSWDYSYGYFEVKNYFIEAIISLIVLVFMVYKFVIYTIKKRLESIYILIYLSGILLVSNIFFLIGSTFAERFLLIPSLGLVLWFVSTVYKQKQLNEYKYYLFGILIVLYSFISYSRVSAWKNDEILITTDYNKKNKSFRTEASYYEYQIVKFKSNPNNLKLRKLLDELTNNLQNKYPEIESIWNLSGDYYKALNRYDLALNAFEKSLSINPNSYTGYVNLGYLYEKTNNDEKAIENYLKAIKINPNTHLPYSNLGLLYHEKEDFKTAKKYYEKSLSITPNNPTIVENLTRVERALLMENPKQK